MAFHETIQQLPSLQKSSNFFNPNTVIAICVFFTLLCLCIIIGHLLEENRWANESITALLLGLCAGVVVLLISKSISSRILVFNEDLFFLYLLPPIIFNAGFQVKKKQFFKNFTTILMFGVFGTVISFCLISLCAFYLIKKIGVTNLDTKDYLAIGAILSATDSVCTLQVLSQDETPFLYSVVFGEGVVNDATSIVLFNAVQSLDFHNVDGLTSIKLVGTFLYLFITSTLLGVAVRMCKHSAQTCAAHSNMFESNPCVRLDDLYFFVARESFHLLFFFGETNSFRYAIGWSSCVEVVQLTKSMVQKIYEPACAFERTSLSLIVKTKCIAVASDFFLFGAQTNYKDFLYKKELHLLKIQLFMVEAGLLSAFIIKTLYFGRHSTDREVAIMIIMAYLSYMFAELINLSGILTIFFCGIVMSHYTWHNVTESSRRTTKHGFATLSFIAETFIFLYVGMDALDMDKWKRSHASAGTSIAVSSTLFGLVLLGRAAFVFPLANIKNLVGKRDGTKIKFRQQVIIAGFSGMDNTSSEDALMITSTLIVVVLSTLVFGSITKPLIEAVMPRQVKSLNSDVTDNQSLEDLRILFLENGDSIDDQDDNGNNNGNNNQPPRRASSLRLLISNPSTTVHYLWRKFDDKFMRPVFGGRGFVPYVPGSPTGEAEADADEAS
ncbi:hypothetical protein EZV62_006909 [Acer yangbiense]|uniref:Cation/H+ exchanger transmembrane domain-containing protein n=1 Tax=Acer yangbiense TaxID=1000413 RepID=A0A5C7I910_9ROSI|nr:hypothetical protein EZV62_006909 [Acer yangbiense]